MGVDPFPRIQYRHRLIAGNPWQEYSWWSQDRELYREGGLSAVLQRLRRDYGNAGYEFQTEQDLVWVDLQEVDPWR